MSAFSVGKGLRDGSSLLALSTVALIAAQPAHAANSGIFGGGSTLASLVMRQVGDCYLKKTVTGDGYTFSSSFNENTPTPGKLPNSCTTSPILLLYGGVGSSAGLRGFVTNDPKQLFRGSVSTTTAAQTIQLPADPPKYLESAGPAPFNAYPYPSVDFGAGDSPLPSALVSTTGTASVFSYNVSPAANWQSAASITATRADTTSTVAYDATKFGKPLQLPLFEAPVAVAVNVPSMGSTGTRVLNGVKWTIKSQVSATGAGDRIQLSTAQVCAIFSGLVTNWNSTATIPYLKSNGTTGTESFAASNTWHAGAAAPGTGGGTPYANKSVPITVVYRSDGSGTSFIFGNYLRTVCPLLDPNNTYGYKTIFTAGIVPDNSFQKLVDAVKAQGRNINWIGASGSDAVALGIGNSISKYGRIGYLSNDFVVPYNPVTTTRPAAARLQNDYLRSAGVYHPGQSASGVAKNFIAPTPANADLAWASLAIFGVTPSTSWTYNDYNVYTKAFPSPTYLPGSGSKVNISGLSILPLAKAGGAYPVVGTAYAYFYSCYGAGSVGSSATRVANLKSFLLWFYDDSRARKITLNNGFRPLASSWVQNIKAEYLQGATSTSITAYNALSKVNGCQGVTGGAK
ncbi:substrate-binding domain-containing protein [Methylosinus sp. Sm6]|uniref:substrate-binding domain-containing protein n=1 Tax=Methylosinus sp. Sm6 TaxID=2866948 RepID=UPI001C991D6B|nr:substrate-binding domain-containing protein [Methylosinus sp. Sm6]MBY6239910.1 substrate-binding domain-containing protein [Methylosinus sp. Sm6]